MEHYLEVDEPISYGVSPDANFPVIFAEKTINNIKIEGTKNYLTGTGAVVFEQSLPPGTKVAKGEVITLTFRHMDADEEPDYMD